MPGPIDFGDPALLPHDSLQDDIIACVVVTWLIGAGFVAARFYTRIAINGSQLGASEWTILAATVCSLLCRERGHGSDSDLDLITRYVDMYHHG